jgi:hypothetical protein
VLPVLAFAAFWVVLAFGLFFVAARGGLGGARAALQTQSREGRKGIIAMLVFVYVGFGVVIPIVFLVGNGASASYQVGGIRLTAGDRKGRELFGEHCGVCHTLAAANTVGKVGPNLDTLKPPKSLVLHTIANGCLPNPPPSSPQNCLGQGVMPSQIVTGRDAENVASFVSKVAGKE